MKGIAPLLGLLLLLPGCSDLDPATATGPLYGAPDHVEKDHEMLADNTPTPIIVNANEVCGRLGPGLTSVEFEITATDPDSPLDQLEYSVSFEPTPQTSCEGEGTPPTPWTRFPEGAESVLTRFELPSQPGCRLTFTYRVRDRSLNVGVTVCDINIPV